MKKIIAMLTAVLAAFSLASCFVDHNDGVCDHKKCDRTFGVYRYDDKHELCLEHAIEEGLEGVEEILSNHDDGICDKPDCGSKFGVTKDDDGYEWCLTHKLAN